MTGERKDRIFAPELVDCVADGKGPSVHALFAVARRVWVDGGAERSAFGWERLASTDPERVSALRIAQAALAGSPTGDG